MGFHRSVPGSEAVGCVFNIQRFSVHDGPGSGCPLRCAWCCNPESQLHSPQLAFNRNKCIGRDECGACLTACQEEAIVTRGDQPEISVDRARCTNCGACEQSCPSKALEMFGRCMSVDEVIREVQQDTCFYSRSAGGLTVSGGEPLSQPEFTVALLTAARDQGLDTAIETCGHAKWSDLEWVCEHVDGVFYDIKSFDARKHRQFTGVTNQLILENFDRLAGTYTNMPIVVRTPVIPGFNDAAEEIIRIANFIRRFSNVSYELLPYHAFGESKYTLLGRRFPMYDVRPPAVERLSALRDAIPHCLARRIRPRGLEGAI